MYTLDGDSYQKRYRYAILVTGLAAGLVLIGVLAWLAWGKANNPTTPTFASASSDSSETSPHMTAITSNELYFGNAYWGRRMNAWAMSSDLKYAYPFSGLATLDQQSYNAWIAGLECPMANGVTPTKVQEEQLLQFNCDPAYLGEASKWFTAFMLANNHTDNQGAKGFTDTQQNLKDHNIQYFGHYDPESLEDLCDVIAMPATAQTSDGSTQNATIPVTLCGYHGVFKIPSAESLATIKQYSSYMPVIAMAHMGVEYTPAPNKYTINSYHGMIDNGADVVLGDHPHWVQTSEVYNDHLIIYSMGNFLFDQQGSAELTRSAGIRVLITIKDSDSGLLQKWADIGSQCASYQDDCLQRIKDAKLAKLPYTMSFGIVGTDDSNQGVTKLADQTVQNGILERLGWEQTKAQLKQPYSAL